MGNCYSKKNGDNNNNIPLNELPLQQSFNIDDNQESSLTDAIGGGYKIVSKLEQNGLLFSSNFKFYKVKNNEDFTFVLKQIKLSVNNENKKLEIKGIIDLKKLNNDEMIVKYHDIYFSDDKRFLRIIMDFYEDRNFGNYSNKICTFEEILREENRLEKDRIYQYLLQINNAIEHLHGLRIVHGDLQPSNIFVKTSDLNEIKLKVTAFGINSRTYKRATAYHAPEQRKNDNLNALHDLCNLAKCDAVDIWALGVIFFEMKTNCMPNNSLINKKRELYNNNDFNAKELTVLKQMIDFNGNTRITASNLKAEITKLQNAV